MKITGSMKIAGSIKNQAVPDPNLYLFDFDKYPPSIANLPPALTINGTTIYPTFRYKGGDANSSNWNPWGYGQTLTLQAGTAPTYNNGSPLLGDIDDSVLFNGGGYYLDASGTTFGNVSTNDIVIECIFRVVASKILFAKSNAGVGFVVGIDATPALYVTIQDASGSVTVTSTALTSGAINCATIYLDRSGSGQIYIQGAASGSAVTISGRALTLNVAVSLAVGSDSAGTNQYTSNLYYLALWQGASWLDTHLQATVAAERFYRLTGVYPHQAKGTALPSVCTRNSASYLDKIEPNGTTKLYYVGAGWPRSCSRVDSNGKTVKGFLDEASIQNLFLQTQTFGSTSWIKQNSSVTADSIVSPDGTMTADIIVENGVNSGHGVSPAINVDVGNVGQNIVYSVYAKAINQNYMYFNSQCAMDQSAAFDLTNGNSKVSNSTYIPNYGTIYCGNGWYRCWISFPVWRENWFFAFYSCSTYGWTGYQGTLGVQAISLWGAQAELGSYPSSYIPTTTVAVTRAADALRYNGNNVTASKGTLSYNLLLPSYDLATSCVAVSLNNAGSSTANIESGVNASGDASELKIVNSTTQVDITGTTDIVANTQKKICHTWQTNEAHIYIANTEEGTADTSCSIPTGIDRIDLSDYNGANQINGLINNLKILPVAVKS